MIDFLIIGGGIAGQSAAAQLSAHGSVALLEAEDSLGYHTSGRSAALYEANYGLQSTVALNLASEAYHRTHNGGYLTPRGLLVVAKTADETVFKADLDDLNLSEIGLDAARKIVPILNPDTVAFAAFHDAALDIDTDRLMQDFTRVVRSNGGQVLPSHAVLSMHRANQFWQVETNSETFQARVVVNAAGAWADEIAVMAGIEPVGLTPYRRSMARLPAPGGHDVSRWPMVMGAGETWYAKPDAGKWLVSPADTDPTKAHDAFADDMVLAEGLARYQEMVTEPVTRVETNWAGLRTFAPDKALVLGPDPDQPSFIWCAGQGGYGFQTAPAASQLLCDLVTGDDSELDAMTVAALSPNRFR
ncbi:MAG: FAD-binding oxidoreductase [Rhodobacteraceae bacterium]|nr:FAD-binding oxidoreductase [Paracoccaceae bacterium]